MNNVCTNILYMNNKRIDEFGGNYDTVRFWLLVLPLFLRLVVTAQCSTGSLCSTCKHARSWKKRK